MFLKQLDRMVAEPREELVEVARSGGVDTEFVDGFVGGAERGRTESDESEEGQKPEQRGFHRKRGKTVVGV